MKKQSYSKKARKPSKKIKSKTHKKKTRNVLGKKHLKKNNRVKSKNKSITKKRNMKKQEMKKVMKGGAIPFSELNPSTVMEHTFSGVKGGMSGTLADTAQSVPNNLESGPSVLDQPYLDATTDGTLNVAGASADTHFANV
jgi:hypothetical protein